MLAWLPTLCYFYLYIFVRVESLGDVHYVENIPCSHENTLDPSAHNEEILVQSGRSIVDLVSGYAPVI